VKSLPPRPSLRHLRNEAQQIVRSHRRGQRDGWAVLRNLRRFAGKGNDELLASPVTLVEAQFALALEYGFASWKHLKEHVKQIEQKGKAMSGSNSQTSSSALTLPPRAEDWNASKQLPDTLDDFQVNLVLSALPNGTQITRLSRFHPIYRYPLVVHVRLPSGEEQAVELLAYGSSRDSAVREAQLLPVLAQLGLPVPGVLAGPLPHPDYPQVGEMVVQSHLPGQTLPFVRATAEQLDFTCRLMMEGIQRLRQLTGALQQHPIGNILPHRTLVAMLESIVNTGGPWMDVPLFRLGIETLRPQLQVVRTLLVFSNGLNISWNFLHDGQKLTGFHDFARACFEDPHIQFAKYKIWEIDEVGWKPFARAGFVERYLYEQNVSKREFAIRLALQCLWRLQEAIPVAGEDSQWGRERESCLTLLESSLDLLR
jgi:hypothetical protein